MLDYILFVIGIILLIKSADYLVDGASSLAKRLGVSTLVIGLTIVSLGTSLPELIVNIIASLQGSSEIAFGNILGSNMSNTLLVLGVISLISVLDFKKDTVKQEIPFSFFGVLLLLIFFFINFARETVGNYLSRINGLVLIGFFIMFLSYVFRIIKRDRKLKKEASNIEIKEYSYFIISLMIIGGLVGLFYGGKWTVDGAVKIAAFFGLSEFLISATIIAIGTSLPELVTCVVAVIKKNQDLAVGNIIGSNIFNIFFVLGVTSIIKPLEIMNYLYLDLILLLFVTLLLFLFMFIGGKNKLNKWQGLIFVIIYLFYILFLIFRG